MIIIEKLSGFCGKYMSIMIVGAGVFALLVPAPFLPVANVSVAGIPLTSMMIGIVMLGMGMTITANDFKLLFKSPKEVILSSLGKYLIMPSCAFLIASVFDLEPELALGIILLGCIPSGTSGNIITLLVNGDIALSATTTVITTFLSPILTPLLVYFLAGAWIDIDFFSMFKSIIIVVLVPVILGMCIRKCADKRCDKLKPALAVISVFLIMLILAISIAPNQAVFLSPNSAVVMLVVCLLFISGLMISQCVTKMFKVTGAKGRTLPIAIVIQNSVLAAGLVAEFPGAVVPAILATAMQPFIGSIFANILLKIDAGKSKSSQLGRRKIGNENI